MLPRWCIAQARACCRSNGISHAFFIDRQIDRREDRGAAMERSVWWPPPTKSIAWYSQRGRFHEALKRFDEMQSAAGEGVFLINVAAFIRILKACGRVGAAEKGRRIHEEIVKRGLLGQDLVLGNALVYMYSECGHVLEARRVVVEELSVRDVITWSTLLAGYTRLGLHQEAMDCFDQIQQREGCLPNAVMLALALKACGGVGATDAGIKIHDAIVKRGLLLVEEETTKTNIMMLGTALMDMYARCGVLSRARHVLLAELPLRDAVSWNVLMAGYARHGLWHETWDCFKRMECEALAPDSVTFICCLKAIATAASVDAKGLQIHSKIVSMGLMDKDMVLGTALVSMYAKCGLPSRARQLLEQLPARNVVSWNSMIAGYAQQRQARGALDCLEQMRSEGVSPDPVSFLGVLTACSRSGRLEEAERVLSSMKREHGIAPSVEHGASMVAGLGSGGRFDKAVCMIRGGMPCFNDPAVWRALLGGCRKWANGEVGRLAFGEAAAGGGGGGERATAYMLMAAIAAAEGGGGRGDGLSSHRIMSLRKE